MNVLGVRIDCVSKAQARASVAGFLSSTEQHMVFTPNPEMLVDARRDPYFRDVLNTGALNLCDGRGTQFVLPGRFERIPGTDFMLELCALAEEANRSVYLLGSGSNEVVEQLQKRLKREFPRLRIVGTHPGPRIVHERTRDRHKTITVDETNDAVVDDIIMAAPDMLFVAFGHGKQEKWIDAYLPSLPSVRVAMGVGGAFDFLSGKVKRAPGWLSFIGLEWLWRLILQPWRIKRIWKATVLFSFYVLRDRTQI